MGVNLKDIVVRLDAHEVQRLLAIEMDEDADEAFMYLRDVVAKKVKEALQPH